MTHKRIVVRRLFEPILALTLVAISAASVKAEEIQPSIAEFKQALRDNSSTVTLPDSTYSRAVIKYLGNKNTAQQLEKLMAERKASAASSEAAKPEWRTFSYRPDFEASTPNADVIKASMCADVGVEEIKSGLLRVKALEMNNLVETAHLETELFWFDYYSNMDEASRAGVDRIVNSQKQSLVGMRVDYEAVASASPLGFAEALRRTCNVENRIDTNKGAASQ